MDRVHEDKESTCEIVKIEIKECQNKIDEKGVDAITGVELNNIVTLNEDDKGIVIAYCGLNLVKMYTDNKILTSRDIICRQTLLEQRRGEWIQSLNYTIIYTRQSCFSALGS